MTGTEDPSEAGRPPGTTGDFDEVDIDHEAVDPDHEPVDDPDEDSGS